MIDWDGNRIDENGYLLDSNGEHLLDEQGNYKLSENLPEASSQNGTATESAEDGVSNLDAPAPPEGDESDTTEDNNAESEGITNEEAGLE